MVHDRIMMQQRVPIPALRPFVALLWASDETDGPLTRTVERERVLPTGAMHVVFRLSPEPLRLFDTADAEVARAVGHAIVGGPRASCYVRDVSAPSRSVGAMLHPGTARLLFGGSAAELAGQHTRLEDLWGPSAQAARERLLESRTPERQLELLESLLIARLPRVRGLHPAVAEALGKLADAASVRGVVADSGYSHRRFISLFAEAVGLTPKLYARVVRFRRVLARMAPASGLPLAELALAAGYADQAHFNRDFREMAGISPTQYRAAVPLQPHHVPILPARR
jgi:AraC-like DNA-binding protein